MAEDKQADFQALYQETLSLAEEKLELATATLLLEKSRTVAVAESLTGGLISYRLTKLPGSSNYFVGGIVCYHNRAKIYLAGVPPKLIGEEGPVSEATAQSLAENVRQKTKSDIGLAATGWAGPESDGKSPVGLVYIALADETGTAVRKFQFDGDREAIRFKASQAALTMLWLRLGGGAP